jgi:large subunit ribosomal protein L4
MPERRKKKNLKSTKHLARKTKTAVKKTPKKTQVKKPKAQKPSAAARKEGGLSVHDLKGKVHETIALDPLFESGPINTGVVYQAVLMYQAGQREGTAATKNRGDVSGGGKKPWRQKGTGQARHGSRRSPIWRGGGTTFGPSPRDYSYSVPLQIKRKAVIEGVKDKVRSQKLFLVNGLEIASPKTRLVAEILDVFKLEKPLFLVEKKTDNLILASRNLPQVAVKTAEEVNALDMLSHKECLMTKAAYAGLVKRLKS